MPWKKAANGHARVDSIPGDDSISPDGKGKVGAKREAVDRSFGPPAIIVLIQRLEGPTLKFYTQAEHAMLNDTQLRHLREEDYLRLGRVMSAGQLASLQQRLDDLTQGRIRNEKIGFQLEPAARAAQGL